MTDVFATPSVSGVRAEQVDRTPCREEYSLSMASAASRENAAEWRRTFSAQPEQACQSSEQSNILDGFHLVKDAVSTVATKVENVASIAGLVGVSVLEGAKDFGNAVISWVGEHPKTAIAIAVGVGTVATILTFGAATPAVAAGLAALTTAIQVGGVVAATAMTAKAAYDVTKSGDLETLWNQEHYSPDKVRAARENFVEHTKDAAFFDATLGLGPGLRIIGNLAKGAEATGEIAAGANAGRNLTRGAATTTSDAVDGTTAAKEVTHASKSRGAAPAPAEVSTGDWSKVNLAAGESISTSNLGPCVSVISDNGVMAHLNPDWQGVAQIDKFIQFLRQNATPNTSVALVGGMDNFGQSYSQFKTSADMVSYLKAQLQKAGIKVKFEDLYGEHQRRVVLDSNKTLNISDGWDPKYFRTFTFGE